MDLRILYLRELLKFKVLSLFIISLFIVQCSPSLEFIRDKSVQQEEDSKGILAVPGQVLAPSSIKSTQLYREGNINSTPIIRLKSNEKLVLSFDELSSVTGQYSVKFTHHNQDWSLSNLPENWFIDGISEVVIGNGEINTNSSPTFHRYQKTFPTNNFSFIVSGNYMLHVYDFQSNVELFSLPFFVTEQSGISESYVETNFNAGSPISTKDSPFVIYAYPDFVEFPQFDLRFNFVQNRFWGITKKASAFDIAEEGNIRFYLNQSDGFDALFDFIELDLTELSISNPKIVDWIPGEIPPKVVLRDDQLNFSSSPNINTRINLNKPKTDLRSRYSNVTFRLDTGFNFDENSQIYVVGDFNQWSPDNKNRLIFNPQIGLFEKTQIIKEGSYSYKYMIQDLGNEKRFIPINESFAPQSQEYTYFIYFTDPQLRYQRLLHVGTVQSNN